MTQWPFSLIAATVPIGSSVHELFMNGIGKSHAGL